MTDPGALGAIFGLISAIGWGAGDFSGGLASRRAHVLFVVLVSELGGVLILIGLAWFLAEPVPRPVDLVWGGLAGIIGTAGLLSLYRGLATGAMGVVAPLSAVVTAVVPLLFGFVLEGPAGARQLFGFGVAIVAVWLVSRPQQGGTVRLRDLGLPIGAGLGFGLFLIMIDHVSDSGVLWPLVSARISSLFMLFAMVAFTRRSQWPTLRQVPLMILAGLFDVGGNTFYALAARMGRLDTAAVLSSLFPVVTVLLARFVLQERLSCQQWVGVAVALVAVVLIAS
jgi:drug/metabolite transporter (DMT)-like permease